MGVCETVYSDRAELMTQWAVGVNPQDPLPPSFKCRGFDSQLPNVFLRVSEGDCQAQLLQHSLLKWVLVPPLIGICQKLAPKHFFSLSFLLGTVTGSLLLRYERHVS